MTIQKWGIISIVGMIITAGILLFFGSPSMLLLVQALVVLIPLATILLSLSIIFSQKRKVSANDKNANSRLAKILASVIIALLGASTTIKFLIGMGDINSDYSGLGYNLTFFAVVITFVLSSIQRDIYWVSQAGLKLDERQLRQRQQVFELSYKIGTGLVFITALILGPTAFLNSAFALLAIPLIIAAWKKR